MAIFLVQNFLKGPFLFKMVRKALLKNNQASSTDGVSFQDIRPGQLERPAEVFQGAFDSDEGWSFDRGPITDASNEAVIAEILVENSRGVVRGQVGKDYFYEDAHVYGFGVVPGRFPDNLCEIEGIYLRLLGSRGVKHIPI